MTRSLGHVRFMPTTEPEDMKFVLDFLERVSKLSPRAQVVLMRHFHFAFGPSRWATLRAEWRAFREPAEDSK